MKGSRSSIAVAALSLVLGAELKAQELTTPPVWRWRLEAPARLVTGQQVPDSAWRFVGMPPGWHINSGPGVIVYHPQERASGRYSLAAAFAVFPRPTEMPYGLVLGATDLNAASPRYMAVQLRRDGAVRVVEMAEGREAVLAPWTVYPAVKPHPGGGVVTNRLRVAVAPDSVRIFVNDSALVAVSAAGLATDGQFGLQAGKGLDLHVTFLDVIRHLAPGRP